MVRVYSFDVFDTCLTRVYLRPVDLFYRLGIEISRHINGSMDTEWAAEFSRCRVHAERKARKLSAKHDIQLQEIYGVLNLEGLPDDLSGIMQMEVELEHESQMPIAENRSRLEGLRKAGKQIAFLSDMYLPDDFFRRTLKKHSLMEDSDMLYVSGSLGINKGSGKLFRHFLSRHNLQACEVMHIGDNRRSDVAAARRIGIVAEHYRDSAYTAFEKAWSSLAGFTAGGHLAAVFGGAARSTRLHWPRAENAQGDRLGFYTAVMLPLLSGYVLWQHALAREHGSRVIPADAADSVIISMLTDALGIDSHHNITEPGSPDEDRRIRTMMFRLHGYPDDSKNTVYLVDVFAKERLSGNYQTLATLVLKVIAEMDRETGSVGGSRMAELAGDYARCIRAAYVPVSPGVISQVLTAYVELLIKGLKTGMQCDLASDSSIQECITNISNNVRVPDGWWHRVRALFHG